ncbi:MAG: nucleoid-associated protein [Eubacteriaceae bacterium]
MTNEVSIIGSILHILDNSGGISIISDKTISSSSDIDDYLEKHLKKCFYDIEVKNTVFENEMENEFLSLAKNFIKNDNFLETSKKIAKKFIDFMINGTKIPSGDLIIVNFIYEENTYLGILKFNYKNSYVHYVDSDDGIQNIIVKQPCSLPLETQKLDEFVIINLADFKLIVKEKKYEINGKKEKYLSKYILNSKIVISDKEVVDIVEKTARNLIRNEYDDDVTKLSTFRRVISDDFQMANEIDIENIANITFENENTKNSFKEKIQKAGIQDNKIKISPNIEKKIVKKQKIVTDSGIEISIPSNCLMDNEKVEFVNNIDGTISIVIKNIEDLRNK